MLLSKLIFSRISSKECANRPSFKRFLLIPSTKYQQEHCILMPCWTFLLRLGIGFLVGPAHSRMGKRPAFFVFGHRHSRPGADKKGTLPRVQDCHSTEAAMHPSVRLSTYLSSTAGISNVRQASTYSLPSESFFGLRLLNPTADGSSQSNILLFKPKF